MSKKTLGSEVSNHSVPFTVRVETEVRRVFHINIHDVIEHLTDIEDAITALQIATEQDEVKINLNCRGGDASVGDTLMHAIANCQAPIFVYAAGDVASFATFILLEADGFELSPFTDILCHSASFGTGGKQADVVRHANFVHKQSERILRHYYEGFFTEEELSRIINDKYEHYMDAEEFMERYQKRESMREAADEAAVAEVKVEQNTAEEEVGEVPLDESEVIFDELREVIYLVALESGNPRASVAFDLQEDDVFFDGFCLDKEDNTFQEWIEKVELLSDLPIKQVVEEYGVDGSSELGEVVDAIMSLRDIERIE